MDFFWTQSAAADLLLALATSLLLCFFLGFLRFFGLLSALFICLCPFFACLAVFLLLSGLLRPLCLRLGLFFGLLLGLFLGFTFSFPTSDFLLFLSKFFRSLALDSLGFFASCLCQSAAFLFFHAVVFLQGGFSLVAELVMTKRHSVESSGMRSFALLVDSIKIVIVDL